jgi:hypothetical protein
MGGLWSILGLVFKSILGVAGGRTASNAPAEYLTGSAGGQSCVCGIAGFGSDGQDIATTIKDRLADFSRYEFSSIPQNIIISADAVDPFLAVHDAQNLAWNAALRQNCTALLWGDVASDKSRLDLRFASKQVAFAPHALFLAQQYRFTLPLAEDFTQSIGLLLQTENLYRADDPVQRIERLSELAKSLENQQDRILNRDVIGECGDGIVICFATAALALAENGHRGWCQLASDALEPMVASCFGIDKNVDRDGLARMIPVAGANSREPLLPDQIALLALYGHLLNWAALGSAASRVSMLAVEIWRLLYHRFEYVAGARVAKIICQLRLGEACCVCAREAQNPDLAAEALHHLRHALSDNDRKAYPVLYALTAYHLGDALIAHGELAGTGLLYDSILPFFQATLKVCSRTENLYLWGRAMFALATVQAMQGRDDGDVGILRTAKMNFIQAQQNLEQAGARSAARTAMGGQMRIDAQIAELLGSDGNAAPVKSQQQPVKA